MDNKATDKEIVEVLQGIKDDFRIRFPRIIFGEGGFPQWDFSAEITIPDIAGVLARQQAEIERLRTDFDVVNHTISYFKARAIKEFAEIIVADYPEMEYYLDKLVKERVGEE